MIIGADYYESEEQRSALLAAGRIPIGIGQVGASPLSCDRAFMHRLVTCLRLPCGQQQPGSMLLHLS